MRKTKIISILCMILCMLAACGSEEADSSRSSAKKEAEEQNECDHEWSEATCTEPKTCSICGETKGKPLGHDYIGQSCTEQGVCSRCGDTVPAKGHDWIDATCTAPKKCTICGETDGEPMGHSTTNGICDRCGENIFSPVKVYEDSKVIISYMGADAKGVYFDVENLTDANITIQADSIAINGKSTNDIMMSDDVAPQSIGTVVAKCSVDYKSPIGTVGGQLRIIDFGKSFQSYDAKFTNIVINEDVEIPSLASGALLYEDSRVKIYFNEITSKGVVFDVENMTDVNITIQADSVAINGRSTNNIMMSDDVAPKSTGEVVASCYFDPATKVGTVGGQLRIIDFNKSFQSYNARMDNVVVDENVAVDEQPSGTLVYEDKKVRIFYKDINQSGVIFDVENLTGVNITIQADSVSVNKRSVNDIMMSDDVAPHSVGEVIASCSPEYEGGVTTIGGQLRVIDFGKSFNTYKASFTNVPVE